MKLAKFFQEINYQQFSDINFVDNLTVTNETKENNHAWKISPWPKTLRNNFLKISLEENQSADEIMISFKGKYLLKQYLPKKIQQMGI